MAAVLEVSVEGIPGNGTRLGSRVEEKGDFYSIDVQDKARSGVGFKDSLFKRFNSRNGGRVY